MYNSVIYNSFKSLSYLVVALFISDVYIDPNEEQVSLPLQNRTEPFCDFYQVSNTFVFLCFRETVMACIASQHQVGINPV